MPLPGKGLNMASVEFFTVNLQNMVRNSSLFFKTDNMLNLKANITQIYIKVKTVAIIYPTILY